MRISHPHPNQTLITLSNGTEILISYSTPVAGFIPGTGYVKTEQRYSVITSKHISAYAKHATTVSQQTIDNLLP